MDSNPEIIFREELQVPPEQVIMRNHLMKIKRTVFALLILFISFLLIRYFINKHNINRPVNCTSSIIFRGSNRYKNDNIFWTYNPSSGAYSEIPDIKTEINESDIRSIFCYSGKTWVTYLSNKNSNTNLASIDGKLRVSNIPANRFLGIYKEQLWLYQNDNKIYSVSLSDGRIDPLNLPSLNDIHISKANLSKKGVFAGTKGISDSKTGHLVLVSIDRSKIVNEFPQISCEKAAISPSGNKIAVCDHVGPIRIYDISLQEPVMTAKYNCGINGIWDFKWTKDEQYIVICVPRSSLPILPAGVGQLGLMDISDGHINWLSATTSPRTIWCTAD